AWAEKSTDSWKPVRLSLGSAWLLDRRGARLWRPGLLSRDAPAHVPGESSRLRARDSGRESRQLHQEPRSAACEGTAGRGTADERRTASFAAAPPGAARVSSRTAGGLCGCD